MEPKKSKIFIFFAIPTLLMGLYSLWVILPLLSRGQKLGSLDLGAGALIALLYLYFLLLIPLWLALREANARVAFWTKIILDLLSLALIVSFFLITPPYHSLPSTSGHYLLFALSLFGFISIVLGWILLAKQFNEKSFAITRNIAFGITGILLITGIATAYKQYVPPPGSAPTTSDFKYGVLTRFPDVFFCEESGYSPTSQDGQRKFQELQSNEEEFRTIIDHLTPSLGLYGKTTFTNEEKLAIYREHERLNVIEIKATKENGIFAFQIPVKDNNTSTIGTVIEGIIDVRGPIETTKQEEKFSAICPR